jgi:hypothetical protein
MKGKLFAGTAVPAMVICVLFSGVQVQAQTQKQAPAGASDPADEGIPMPTTPASIRPSR